MVAPGSAAENYGCAMLVSGKPMVYVSASAQMLRAQLQAYTPSSSVAVGDRPPEPCTTRQVFSAVSYTHLTLPTICSV